MAFLPADAREWSRQDEEQLSGLEVFDSHARALPIAADASLGRSLGSPLAL